MVDSQAVSNFRPITSAFLTYKNGVRANPTKDELNFYIPSEGWLGRLLSSYYISSKFPDKQINYVSTDPSGDVCESFWEVVDYLQNKYNKLNPIKNWNPIILQHGSDVPELLDYYKSIDKKIDLSWTSPPYGFQEEYKESYILTIFGLRASREQKEHAKHCKDTYDIEGKLVAGNIIMSEEKLLSCGKKVKQIESGKKVKQIESGDIIEYEFVKYRVFSKSKLGQSRNKASSSHCWNEGFFSPTVKNIDKILTDTGTMMWNVADVRSQLDFRVRCSSHMY